MPFFSVVIPTYNRRERLLRAVKSVLAQRFTDYEIIVVDDGSNDGSLESLAALDGPIRSFRQANKGPAAARTAGVRHSAGTYIAFLDSDDVWFPWTLATFRLALQRYDSPSWVYGSGVIRREGEDQAVLDEPLNASRFTDYSAAARLDGLMPLPTGVVISRELFLANGGFCETMRVGEDVDFWFRIDDADGFVLIEAPALYSREIHDGSLGEDSERSYEGMLALLAREREGAYRGSGARAFTRRAIVSRQLMYYANRCRQRGAHARAARLYVEVLRLQARGQFREPHFGGRRNRFLVTFPLLLMGRALRDTLRRAPSVPNVGTNSSR